MVVGLSLDGDTLLVATDNPLDDAALTAVSQVTGWKAKPCLATRADINGALSAMYGPIRRRRPQPSLAGTTNRASCT